MWVNCAQVAEDSFVWKHNLLFVIFLLQVFISKQHKHETIKSFSGVQDNVV